MTIVLSRKHGLDDQQWIFVDALVSGKSKTEATEAAGYDRNNLLRKANDLLRTPEVARAIHVEVIARLQGDAAKARRIAVKLMQDESVSPKTRADIAFKLLDRAGFGVPKAAETPRDKGKLSLHEMTTDELRSVAQHLEDELAGRAKPVDAPNKQEADSQIIDLLE